MQILFNFLKVTHTQTAYDGIQWLNKPTALAFRTTGYCRCRNKSVETGHMHNRVRCGKVSVQTFIDKLEAYLPKNYWIMKWHPMWAMARLVLVAM
jgi:hypothetical protein